MAYSRELVEQLTRKIVDELDDEVRQMVSGSQEDAHVQASKIIQQSSDNYVRHANDEGTADDADFLNLSANDAETDGSINEQNATRQNDLAHGEEQAVVSGAGGSANAGHKQPSQPTQEDMRRFADLGRRVAHKRKAEADNIYFSGAMERELSAPSSEDINNKFSRQSMEISRRNAASNQRNVKRQEQNERIQYKSCVLMDYEGKERSYKVVRRDCSALASNFRVGDPIYNIAVLRESLTSEVLNMVGSWSRVRNIYVRSEQLIINGVQFIPVIPAKVKDSFPLDTAELIENGCFASIFDWSTLKYMKDLYMLDIDDEYLFRTTIADDLGMSRSVGVKSILKYCERLQHCMVNGIDLLAPDGSEEAVVAKKSLAKGKHFDNLFDGFEFSLYGGTGSIRSWTANNFRNYANSRGNKGLFRYLCGLGAYGAVAVAGFMPDAVAHLGGGLLKGLGRGIVNFVQGRNVEE